MRVINDDSNTERVSFLCTELCGLWLLFMSSSIIQETLVIVVWTPCIVELAFYQSKGCRALW